MKAVPLLALLLLPLPAAAQGSSDRPAPPSPAPTIASASSLGVPEALRGAWFAGESCARPEAMLFLTARSATRLSAEGAPYLMRFSSVALAPGGWTLGTVPGPQVPRLALRSPGPERLETAEPQAKTRDDRLPGAGAAVRQWRRCPQVPAQAAALHAEGLAVLAALEHVEAACGPGVAVAECLAAVFLQADVSGDGVLSVAELARVGRGGAWVATVRAGRPVDAAGAAAAGTAAMGAARQLVETLDFDGDGKLSTGELAQDRAAFGSATGNANGRPGTGLSAVPGMEALNGLLQGTPQPR